MAQSLSRRNTWAVKMKPESQKDFDDVLDRNNVSLDNCKPDEWKSIVVNHHAHEVEALQGKGSGILQIQDEVEMLVSAIQQTTHSISRLADSSKQRAHLRKKISSNKNKLSSLIDKYNQEKEGNEALQATVSEVMKGNFPWGNTTDPESSSDIPRDNNEASLQPEMEENEMKYRSSSMSAVVLEGKLSCAKRGIAFCKSHICSAATKFKAALSGSDYEECLPLEEGAENDDDVDVDDGTYDSTGDCSEDEITFNYKNAPGAGNNVVVLGEGIPHCDTFSWKFPVESSQSTLDGRNGSSACSVIALIFAYGVCMSGSISNLCVNCLLCGLCYSVHQSGWETAFMTAVDTAYLSVFFQPQRQPLSQNNVWVCIRP
ncbi:uncharacterized protein LOC111339239 [Stylophora pistillata]|uniref:uncharacterized protein LOC111339239 n=1 Tax=Stylophora pistillata TaxID=50429 RepID=UPI000C03A32A|nr:uncharacterized protein LOC111339239 [Stylophora pistillata]